MWQNGKIECVRMDEILSHNKVKCIFYIFISILPAVPGTTGTRSYELARRWAKAGHQVTLICGKSDQSGLDLDNKETHYTIDGINIIALNMSYSNSLSFIRRVFSFMRFVILSFWIGLRVKDVDIIYATSTPLTIGIPAILLKWFKRVPFVFEIRDQWPQIPIEMGIIKNPILKAILLWLEKRIYQSSAAIVTLSPGMAQGVKDVLKAAIKKSSLPPTVRIPNYFDRTLTAHLCVKNWAGRINSSSCILGRWEKPTDLIFSSKRRCG